MTGVKIKIECDDPLLAAAVAQSIAEGLQRNDFNNIQVKTPIACSDTRYQNPPTHFGRISLIGLKDPDAIQASHPTTQTELNSPRIALGSGITARMRDIAPKLLKAPILIDTGIENAKYVAAERKFLEGEQT